MNKEEARHLLIQELEVFRSKSFEELTSLVNTSIHLERKAPGGVEYQIEIEVIPDDPHKKNGNVRVMASIDDGGQFSSFRPITQDFIKTPNNDFLGE
jgi:hypothetical protein